MNTKPFLLSGIAGAIVYFLLGWLFYGYLFPDLHSNDADPCMYHIAIGCLFYALLFSYVFNRWAQISTFKSGLRAGFVMGLLLVISMSFFMYSTKEIDTNFFILIVLDAVSAAFMGGTIGYVNGLSQNNKS